MAWEEGGVSGINRQAFKYSTFTPILTFSFSSSWGITESSNKNLNIFCHGF